MVVIDDTFGQPTPSPHFSSRNGMPILGVVVHYDVSPDEPGEDSPVEAAGLNWMRDPRANASAHFHITRTGVISQLVHLDRAAWHAGASRMALPDGRTLSGANLFTIGIELANMGMVHREDDGTFWRESGGNLKPWRGAQPSYAALGFPSAPQSVGWWEPYPDAQIRALGGLLDRLSDAGYADAVRNIQGHDEIATPQGRKSDPGPLFPWGRFPRAMPRQLLSVPQKPPASHVVELG